MLTEFSAREMRKSIAWFMSPNQCKTGPFRNLSVAESTFFSSTFLGNKFLLFEAGEMALRWQQGQGTLVTAAGVPGPFWELPGRCCSVGCEGWARCWLNVGNSGVQLVLLTLQREISSVSNFREKECSPENVHLLSLGWLRLKGRDIKPVSTTC